MFTSSITIRESDGTEQTASEILIYTGFDDSLANWQTAVLSGGLSNTIVGVIGMITAAFDGLTVSGRNVGTFSRRIFKSATFVNNRPELSNNFGDILFTSGEDPLGNPETAVVTKFSYTIRIGGTGPLLTWYSIDEGISPESIRIGSPLYRDSLVAGSGITITYDSDDDDYTIASSDDVVRNSDLTNVVRDSDIEDLLKDTDILLLIESEIEASIPTLPAVTESDSRFIVATGVDGNPLTIETPISTHSATLTRITLKNDTIAANNRLRFNRNAILADDSDGTNTVEINFDETESDFISRSTGELISDDVAEASQLLLNISFSEADALDLFAAANDEVFIQEITGRADARLDSGSLWRRGQIVFQYDVGQDSDGTGKFYRFISNTLTTARVTTENEWIKVSVTSDIVVDSDITDVVRESNLIALIESESRCSCNRY